MKRGWCYERRNRLFYLMQLLALLVVSACASKSARIDWGKFDQPYGPKAVSHGYYSAGCLEGGKSLSLNAKDYQVMNQKRNRYYGHPRLISFVENLSHDVYQKNLGVLMVGDLSQPRGGPMLEGHASHQTGLDVDIWFRRSNAHEKQKMSANEFDQLDLVYLVKDGEMTADWHSDYVQILKKAATAPEVERIFVHARIKKELCKSYQEEPWLTKLRPWWGHDEHFHVRLSCTEGDDSCRKQSAPTDNGCGEDLNWWFSAEAEEELKKNQSSEPRYPDLPPQCLQLVGAGK